MSASDAEALLRPRVRTWTERADGAFLTSAPAGVDPTRLVVPVDTSVVRITRATSEDMTEFCAAARHSVGLHHPWTSVPTTPTTYAPWLEAALPSNTERFLVRHAADGGLVGNVNVQQIFGGAIRGGVLGYSAFVDYAGRGLMTAGLAAVVLHCFTTLSDGGLGLHRLEAVVQPANTRSVALVRRLGFRHEGFSPRLLFIDGAWRDHDRYALTVEDWLAG